MSEQSFYQQNEETEKIPTCTQHLIIKCLSQIVRDI